MLQPSFEVPRTQMELSKEICAQETPSFGSQGVPNPSDHNLKLLHSPTKEKSLHRLFSFDGLNLKEKLPHANTAAIRGPRVGLWDRDINTAGPAQELSKNSQNRFEGQSLGEILGGARKRLMPLELHKSQQSLLDLYRPIRISAEERNKLPSMRKNENGFVGSLEECLLGKRSVADKEKGAEENGSPHKIISSNGLERYLRTPSKFNFKARESLGQSVKKMSLIEREKQSSAIKEKYTPKKLVIAEACDVQQIDSGFSESLEDVLKHSKRKFPVVLIEKEATSNEASNTVKNNTVQPAKTAPVLARKLPEERMLKFDEELLQEKKAYETVEDRVDRAFMHRSTACCHLCKQPLYHPLREEKTKSLACGKKFHMVGELNISRALLAL